MPGTELLIAMSTKLTEIVERVERLCGVFPTHVIFIFYFLFTHKSGTFPTRGSFNKRLNI